MRLLSIASGSSGNSYYIGSDKTTLILDCGIAMKRIVEGLEFADRDMSEVDGIFITHEHIDHIKSLGAISRKYHIPIYATYGTIDAIAKMSSLGVFDYNLLNPISNDSVTEIGDITVSACSIPHDAADPVCYSFAADGKKISVATDLGEYDPIITDFLADSNAMVIEANHDIRMLEVGPYPYVLKQRILGKYGHLSNEAAGCLIRSLLHKDVKYIALGHLSAQNNYPALAYEAVKLELAGNVFSDDVRDFGLCVLSRTNVGEIIDL